MGADMKVGDAFIWKEKLPVVFESVVGNQYYFTCPNYFGEGDAATVCLLERELLHLVRA